MKKRNDLKDCCEKKKILKNKSKLKIEMKNKWLELLNKKKQKQMKEKD